MPEKDLLSPYNEIDPKTGLTYSKNVGNEIEFKLPTSQRLNFGSQQREGFSVEEYQPYWGNETIFTGEYTNLEDERAKRQSA